jgi:cobalt/nickel transport system permease protein
VAGDLGFLGKGASAPYQIMPDYTLPFLGNTPLSTIFAGMIGMVVVGAIIVLLGQGMKAKS